jgi:hypothetical protein
MTKPLVIRISHHLGKEEALRRLKSGLGNVQKQFANLLTVQEQTWIGDRVDFRFGALGQYATGTIAVEEDYVELTVLLPWLLARFAEKLSPLIRDQGRLLLEKK